MRKFRTVVAIVLSVGVLSVGATGCVTPQTPEEQVRTEEWLRNGIGTIIGFWIWNWYHQTFPCPGCV